jgi:hypothetical protein
LSDLFGRVPNNFINTKKEYNRKIDNRRSKMKKKYVPIIALSLAIILVGSIAYASDKKKKTKLVIHEPGEMSEEILKAELLVTSEEQLKKKPATKVESTTKNADVDLSELNQES